MRNFKKKCRKRLIFVFLILLSLLSNSGSAYAFGESYWDINEWCNFLENGNWDFTYTIWETDLDFIAKGDEYDVNTFFEAIDYYNQYGSYDPDASITYEKDEEGNIYGSIPGVTITANSLEKKEKDSDLFPDFPNIIIFPKGNPGRPKDPPPPPDPKDPPQKEPEKNDDCDEVAEAAAQRAQDVLNAEALQEKIDLLRTYANIGKIEYGASFDRSGPDKATLGNIVQGTATQITKIPVREGVIYTIHTHPTGCYTGPSPADIYYVLYGAYRQESFQGAIIIASDGSEYILSVTNRAEVLALFANGGYYTFGATTDANGYQVFTNEATQKEYTDIYKDLIKQGFSPNNANDYAMAYLLSTKNTGLTLSKRESKTNDFKQQTTEKGKDENNKDQYKPEKCKSE